MKDTTIAIDLAKNVFEIGISDRPGHMKESHRLSRGKLRELGFVMPLGANGVVARVRDLIEDAEAEISPVSREVFSEICNEIRELESRIRKIEHHLEAIARQTPEVERLRSIPGVGVLTATALVGFVGDIQRFESGRKFASYLGLTPREHSSGQRRRLGRISKKGDSYLRTLLVHGARSVLWAGKSKDGADRLYAWGQEVQSRRGHNKAAVAMANKLARIVWAVWKRGGHYRPRTGAPITDSNAVCTE